MSSRLLRITEQEWQAKARASRFRVKALARSVGVSPRTLERHIASQFKVCPVEWLYGLRMALAKEMLLEGYTVKETSNAACYKDPSNFAKAYKRHYGTSPHWSPMTQS